MTAFRTLDDADVKGRRVLVRVDLNVPTDDDGRVTDTTRIARAMTTVGELADRGARVVVLSHFGRPKGRDPKESLRALAPVCAEILGRPVAFADEAVGEAAEQAVAALGDGDIVLLENTRFHDGEEKNDPAFVADLAKLGDLYVNDAFSTAHRAHASTEGLAHVLPAFAGRTMQAELEALAKGLETPQRPVVAIVGGAKVSTKLALLENLVTRVDALVVGGGMANTFLLAQGVPVGKSLAERDLAPTALRILDAAEKHSCSVILPVDGVVAWEFKAGTESHAYGLDAIPDDGMILDIGPQSIERVRAAIDDAMTLVWNGPLGAFELEPFDRGTVEAARHAAERTRQRKLVSVAGGGDTIAALNKANAVEDFTYVSTAGGAFLEWLEGKPLPGIAALSLAAERARAAAGQA
ncbi:phosphoglycerate kinase [Pseudochelatococcus lubricantis]|uniref:phosphoglycerate kinase n=1 Tax=Pseudochelatococcus lubricantis TaxID=1538102 RepID=UPI0035E477D0